MKKEKAVNIFLILYFFVISIITLIPLTIKLYENIIPNMSLKNIFLLFYPILFIFLFIKKSGNILKSHDYIIIVISMLLQYFFILNSVISGVWICSLFIFMVLLKGLGIKINYYAIIIFLLIPPFLNKISLFSGFELRLVLSKISGYFLSFFDHTVCVTGTLVIFKNKKFLVDTPCEGLKLLEALILILLILFKTIETCFKNKIKYFILIICVSIFSFFFWIIMNLIRIIVLIIFNIPAKSIFHDLVGLILFFIIIILPLLLFKLIINKKYFFYEIGKNNEKKYKYNYKFKYLILSPVIISIVFISTLYLPSAKKTSVIIFPERIGDFIIDNKINTNNPFGETDYNIASYNHNNILLIIKNNLYPLRFVHHTKNCWKCDGYKIIRENKIYIPEVGIIKESILEKNGNIYTLYWWYMAINKDINSTDSDMEWRINYLFKKINYITINVFFVENTENSLYRLIRMIKNGVMSINYD